MSRGTWKSSSSLRIAGVQWSDTVRSTLWGMASGVAVVLEVRETRRSWTPQGGGPGRRLRVLSVPLGRAHGVAGPLSKREMGPGPCT